MKSPRYFRRFGRRIFLPVWFVAVSIFIGVAASDLVLNLGWGYRAQDILLGVAMMGFGLVFWIVWDRLFKLAERFDPRN